MYVNIGKNYEVHMPVGLSLNNLGHFTPCFGFLLSESQPGRLILCQRCSGRVSASLAFLLYHGCVGQFKRAEHWITMDNSVYIYLHSNLYHIRRNTFMQLHRSNIHWQPTFWHNVSFCFMVLKEVSYAQQGCIYLIKNTVKKI